MALHHQGLGPGRPTQDRRGGAHGAGVGVKHRLWGTLELGLSHSVQHTPRHACGPALVAGWSAGGPRCYLPFFRWETEARRRGQFASLRPRAACLPASASSSASLLGLV